MRLLDLNEKMVSYEREHGSWPKEVHLNPADVEELSRIAIANTEPLEIDRAALSDLERTTNWFRDEAVPIGQIVLK